MSNWYPDNRLPPLSTVVGGQFYELPPMMHTMSPVTASSPVNNAPTPVPLAAKRPKRSAKDEEVSYPVNYPVHPVSLRPSVDESQLKLLPDQVKTFRYATGIDDRNFITVYEYNIGDQPIIWDYFTGYVHLTGIWKALGNSKADIVRLLDGSPELESVFKRVRGGFLKIQGTWVAYEVAKSLSLRFCYPIRYALIPVFGPDFPDNCLEPHETGYGKLQMKPSPSKPRRRSAVERKHPPVVPYQRKTRTQSAPQEPKPWQSIQSEDCAIDTSDEDSDVLPNSPPPMPRKLSFVDSKVIASPPEILEMLQATRSLQQLSSGCSWPQSALGGDFEIEGCAKRYVWDGGENLREAGRR